MALEQKMARPRSQIVQLIEGGVHQRGLPLDQRPTGPPSSGSSPFGSLSAPRATPLGKMKWDAKRRTRISSLGNAAAGGASPSSALTIGERMDSNKMTSKANLVANTSSNYHCSKPTRSTTNSNKLAFLLLVTSTTILILLTCLTNQRVASLNCITCSSADNPGCDETYSANITDTRCDLEIGRPAKVCRKIVQYVENKRVVIRSCGWIDEHEDKKPMCYKRSGTFALMMESCICYEDNCNHSASLVPNRSVFISLACGSSVYFLYMLLASCQYQPRGAH